MTHLYETYEKTSSPLSKIDKTTGGKKKEEHGGSEQDNQWIGYN